MKKPILILSLLFSFVLSYGQSISNRANATITVQDARLAAQYNFFIPRYADTTAANVQKGIDSLGAIIFTYDVMGYWGRAWTGSAKAWARVGSGTGINIYNSDGTLPGDRLLSGSDLYALTLDSLTAFTANANVAIVLRAMDIGGISSALGATPGLLAIESRDNNTGNRSFIELNSDSTKISSDQPFPSLPTLGVYRLLARSPGGGLVEYTGSIGGGGNGIGAVYNGYGLGKTNDSTLYFLPTLRDSIIGLIPSSATVIQNQYASKQNPGNFWIDSTGRWGDNGDSLGVVFSDNFNRIGLGPNYDSASAGSTTKTYNGQYLEIAQVFNGYGNYISRTPYTGLNRWEQVVTFIALDQNAASFGIAVGVRSANSFYNVDLLSQLYQYTPGGDLGKTQLYYGESGANLIDKSTTALSYAVGDTVEYHVRREDFTLYISALNKSTGATMSYTYQYTTSSVPAAVMHNTGKFTMWFIGGGQKILNWTVKSIERKGTVAVMGNSIMVGYTASSLANRWVSRTFGGRYLYEVEGGAGDRSNEGVLNVNEVKTLAKTVIYFLGVNDAQSGGGAPAFSTNTRLIWDTLRANNIRIIAVSLCPNNSNNVTVYNDTLSAIATRYGVQYINTYDSLRNGTAWKANYTADGIHPNDSGHLVIARIVSRSVPSDVLGEKYIYQNRPAYSANATYFMALDPNDGSMVASIPAGPYWGLTGNSPTTYGNFIGNLTAFDYRVFAGGAEYLRIDSLNGGVSIGVPVVAPTFGFTARYPLNNATAFFQATGSNATSVVVQGTTDNTNADFSEPAFSVRNSSNTPKFFVREDGFAASATGIGTSDSKVALINSTNATPAYHTGLNLCDTCFIQWGASSTAFGTKDVFLQRRRAGELAITLGGVLGFEGDLYLRNLTAYNSIKTVLSSGASTDSVVVWNPTDSTFKKRSSSAFGSVSSFTFTDGSGFDGTVTNSATTPTLSLTTTLTSGSIPYIGASGALSENTSSLKWDNSNTSLQAFAKFNSTENNPTYAAVNDPNTGVNLNTNDGVSVINNAVHTMLYVSNEERMIGTGQRSWSSSSAGAAGASADIGLKRSAAGVLQITNGSTGLGKLNTLFLNAGTTAANTAPLKFTSGTSLTSAEAGAMEFTTDDLFFTITTGTARKRLLMADPSGGLTSGRVPFATTNGRLTDDAGLVYASGTLGVGAFLNVGGTTTPGAAGIFNLAASSQYGILNSAIITPGAGVSAYVYNQQGIINEAGSGTHALLAGMAVIAPTINSGAATVTNTASLYIDGPPSATVTGGNYSLYIAAGNLAMPANGSKLIIGAGANGSIGTSSAMVAGTTTVNTTAVTASSKIFVTVATPGGLQGFLSIGTIVAGTSFVINSSSATETSVVNWWIIN